MKWCMECKCRQQPLLLLLLPLIQPQQKLYSKIAPTSLQSKLNIVKLIFLHGWDDLKRLAHVFKAGSHKNWRKACSYKSPRSSSSSNSAGWLVSRVAWNEHYSLFLIDIHALPPLQPKQQVKQQTQLQLLQQQKRPHKDPTPVPTPMFKSSKTIVIWGTSKQTNKERNKTASLIATTSPRKLPLRTLPQPPWP